MVKPRLFMDSGAFSANSQKETIDLEEYAKFLIANDKYISIAAALDVIGDDEATFENQKKLEGYGAKAIPTFHVGEDFKWLRYYVEHYDYIGLGGTASRVYGREYSKKWLDECWSQYLTDKDGFPLVRVHGFAATSVSVMQKYPWYSVDSTSWLMAAAAGKALFCDYEYSRDGMHIIEVPISEKSPFRERRNMHLDSLPLALREAAAKLIDKHGFEIEKLATDYKQRFLSNAKAYVEFASHVKYHPLTIARQGSLFEPPPKKLVTRARVPAWDALTFYLAGNPGNGDITYDLMKMGYNRLLSYFYINDGKHWAKAKQVLDEHDMEHAPK